MKKLYIILIIAILSLCIAITTINISNSEKELKIKIDLNSVNKIVWRKNSILSYEIVDDNYIKGIINMIMNLKGENVYIYKENENIPLGMYNLIVYRNNDLVMDITVLSEREIIIGRKKFKLDISFDLEYIENIIKKISLDEKSDNK